MTKRDLGNGVGVGVLCLAISIASGATAQTSKSYSIVKNTKQTLPGAPCSVVPGAISADLAFGGATAIPNCIVLPWKEVSGGLTRVALAGSTTLFPGAWGVNGGGQIWRYSEVGWAQMPGGGTDIAVGPGGEVWVIGSKGSIWQWNGTDWAAIDGELSRIAVGPGNVVWGVNGAGEIWRRQDGKWTKLPGAARAIAVDAQGTAYILGTAAVPGGFEISTWNGSAWTKLSGGAVEIAAAQNGVLWAIDSGNVVRRFDGAIWMTVKGNGGHATAIGTNALGVVWLVQSDGPLLQARF